MRQKNIATLVASNKIELKYSYNARCIREDNVGMLKLTFLGDFDWEINGT